MEKKKKIRSLFTDILELPEEISLDLPKIVLLGNQRLSVENHKGIISYGKNEVKLRVNDGYLVALGNNFVLKGINQTDLFLQGEILNLRMVLDSCTKNDDLCDDLATLLAEEYAEAQEVQILAQGNEITKENGEIDHETTAETPEMVVK